MIKIIENIKTKVFSQPIFKVFMWYCNNDLISISPQLYLASGNDIKITSNGKVKDPDIPQNQRTWEREEVVLLVAEYFRTRDLSPDERSASIEMISTTLRNRAVSKGEDISYKFRNTNGIKMQFGCIKGLDPVAIKSGLVGLSGASKLQKQIVEEYLSNDTKIKEEANIVLLKFKGE